MKNKNAILALLKKDFLLELRQQYTLYGIILYVVTTIFVVYLSMGQPDDQVWNGLFWVIQLFVCVNAVAKSFLQEGSACYTFTPLPVLKILYSQNLFLTSYLCLA